MKYKMAKQNKNVIVYVDDISICKFKDVTPANNFLLKFKEEIKLLIGGEVQEQQPTQWRCTFQAYQYDEFFEVNYVWKNII